MTQDQIVLLAQRLLGPDGLQKLAALVPAQQALPAPTPEPVAVAPAPVEPQAQDMAFTSQEVLLVKLFREFVAQEDDGKQLVALMGKFQRFAQSQVGKS